MGFNPLEKLQQARFKLEGEFIRLAKNDELDDANLDRLEKECKAIDEKMKKMRYVWGESFDRVFDVVEKNISNDKLEDWD